MNKEIFGTVVSKEYLLVITDTEDNILFKTDKSPVSQFYESYYKKEIDLDNKEISVYANQIGVALATLCELEKVVEYNGHQISEPAKYLINKLGIRHSYNEEIDLVKSSKDSSKVCPIEEGLYKMENLQDRIKFLEDKYK